MAAAARPVTDDLVAGLRGIVGQRGLLLGADVATRSCDPFRDVPPEGGVIVRPASTGEVSRVLAFCHARGQRVVTHGGRTGVAGGAYAGLDEIILSLERFAQIEEIDAIGMSVVVQAGATLEAVQDAVAADGLLYPIDLGAKGSATIGGTIATNAGGNRVVRWGMTRANVLGLEAVLADGTIVSAMNRLVKNNSGYDVKQLFIGSEGTLGVVTRAVLKLVPAPSSQSAALLALPDFASVLDLLGRARRLATLSAFEVMWSDYYRLVATSGTGRDPLPPAHPYYVLVEVMGHAEEVDRVQFDAFLGEAHDAGLIADAVVAGSGQQIAELWRVREASEVLVRTLGSFVSFDVSIEERAAESFVEAARAALTSRFETVRTVTFGHLGDNNLHVGVHVGPDTFTRETEVERCVYAVVKEHGGALSAEHGVGRFKREFLPEHVSPGALDVMRRVRSALDPSALLNHEVLF
ncbi:FAD-binding oxidoreductase [Flavisphingomonas formosensis]|uniref:FAD-binding oxidoreductase n=1 Tax=Flavisphingomonas formosensis TaxID=861534 RepID=UPI0012FAD74D|nr:FAD-binding oxidoreductase [Sphingomonas formosensis]